MLKSLIKLIKIYLFIYKKNKTTENFSYFYFIIKTYKQLY